MSIKFKRRMRAMLAAFGCALAPNLAAADAIFGCWSFEGERLEVTPTAVVTPGGASPAAKIDRHGASYVAPEGERDAGARLVFRQLNEELILRRIAGDRGAPEYWTPCGVEQVS